MADWRQSGCVPDSDDDCDSDECVPLEIQASVNKPCNQHGSNKTLGSLEKEELHEIAAAVNVASQHKSNATAIAVRVFNRPQPRAISVQPGVTPATTVINGLDDEVDELQVDQPGQTLRAGFAGSISKKAPGRPSHQQSQDVSSISKGIDNHAQENEGSQRGAMDHTPAAHPAADDDTDSLSSLEGSIQSDIFEGRNNQLDTTDAPSGPDQASAFLRAQRSLSPNFAIQSCRNLRRRKAIQLHPYLVEGERYRKTFHDRGINPVRIAQIESQSRKMDESQSQGFNSSAESSSSTPEQRIVSPSLPQNPHEPSIVPDDEFPDMRDLLERQNTQFKLTGNKRRKLSRPKFKRPPGMIKASHAQNHSQAVDSDNLPHQTASTKRKDFGTFLSPPASESEESDEAVTARVVRSRRLRFVSPKPLPTPAVSSETRPPPSPIFFEDDGFLQPDSCTSGVARDREASEDSDAESIPIQIPNPLDRVKTKIRGVLPASWLRLDFQAQSSVKDNSRPSKIKPVSPDRRGNVKGVARVLTRRPSGYTMTDQVSPRRDVFILSDDNDQDSVSSQKIQPSGYIAREAHMTDLDEDLEHGDVESQWREAVEENEIDMMLPVAHRQPKRSRNHTRQRKMSEFTSGSSRRHGQQRSMGGGRRTSTGLASGTTLRRPKFRPPELSIVDVFDTNSETSQANAPRFLKVAQRTAKGKRDLGRHSPSRKYLRLGTRKDTEDANRELDRWKKGALSQKPSAGDAEVLRRKPLAPKSCNIRGLEAPIIDSESHPNGSSRLSAYRSPSGKGVKSKKNSSISSTLEWRDRARSHPPVQEKAVSQAHEALGAGPTRGPLISSVKDNCSYRPAALENEDPRNHRQSLSLQALHSHSRLRRPELPNFAMDKFFEATPLRSQNDVLSQQLSDPMPTRGIRQVKRERKRRPRQLDLTMTWQEDLDDAPPLASNVNHSPEEPGLRRTIQSEAPFRQLKGLGSYGTKFSSTFEVMPFPRGTCFNDRTILGGGVFNRSLQVARLDLNRPRGNRHFMQDDKSYHWGPWNDAVLAEIIEISEKANRLVFEFSRFMEAFETIKVLLLNLVEYCSGHLHFLDPIDRIAFLQQSCGIVHRVERIQEDHSSHIRDSDLLLSNWMLLVIFVNQLKLIATNKHIEESIRNDVAELFKHHLQRLIGVILSFEGEIVRLVASVNSNSYQNMSIENKRALEAFVIASLVSRTDSVTEKQFVDSVLEKRLAFDPVQDTDATVLEQAWKRIFHFLPCLAFDDSGVCVPGDRFIHCIDGWSQVRGLLIPVFKLYETNRQNQGPNFNSYCRTLLARCLHLINFWGWRKCDALIGYLFDFFAGNRLHYLLHEESHGSPRFLESLHNDLVINLEPDDRTYHIFLKIVGSGIRYMRAVSSEKKIRDLIWRLMPNHGRSHPKEEAVRQEDIDALRNHHDLLSTLYWASPPHLRPKLPLLRNLVHIESSHREACCINIRTWSNLISYQLSTNEPVTALEPFVEWFEDLLHQLIRQHGLARTEAEQQVHSIQHHQGLLVSDRTLESTISNNQRQIEAMLCDVLAGLHRALRSARTKETANKLLSPRIADVFHIFDTARPQTNAPVLDVLEILLTYLNRHDAGCLVAPNRISGDESQDYGDFPSFDDEELDYINDSPQPSIEIQMRDPVRQLLSNCLGADFAPADNLMQRVVDCWVALSRKLVKAGQRTWSDFIGTHGTDTWHVFRDTDQRQKFAAYFLSALIQADRVFYSSQKELLLHFWMDCLVERESLLKFQHILTASILNADPNNPMLCNLPFWRNGSAQRYVISAKDFSERRLSLISSVLWNMRKDIDRDLQHHQSYVLQRKEEYKVLLRHLMNSMKRNYQQLGQGTGVTGAYVDFVQKIVEFLQHFTSGICPIDRFFTDNVSFPLPAHDPTYIVGQLKSYGLRLDELRAPKELAIFLQSVTERAAVDNQESYLSEQLYAAMSNASEDGSPRPTLRSFVIRAIFPPYASLALSSSCGWILIRPFLEAFGRHFAELNRYMDGCNESSSHSIHTIIASYLQATLSSLLILSRQPTVAERPSSLKTIRGYYVAAAALLPTLDYLTRLGAADTGTEHQIEAMRALAIMLGETLLHGVPIDPLVFESIGTDPHVQDYNEVRAFATTELQRTLNENWQHVSDKHFYSRGNTKKEVMAECGLYEEEKADLIGTLAYFVARMDSLPAFAHDERIEGETRVVTNGLEELIL